MKTENNLTEFLHGFAAEADIAYASADAHWAAFSRQLSDWEREEIEAGGREAGREQARAWKQL